MGDTMTEAEESILADMDREIEVAIQRAFTRLREIDHGMQRPSGSRDGEPAAPAQ